MKNHNWSLFFNGLLFTLILQWTLSLHGCASQKHVEGKAPETQVQTAVNGDSTQYELIVFDPGFETFLATLPYGKEFYSDNYYQTWNIRYVQEWNQRCHNPLRYGSFYETPIPYEANIEYGLDFNFRLYHYFLFIEKKYGIVLIHRRVN